MTNSKSEHLMPYVVKRMPRLLLVGLWILMAVYSIISLFPDFHSVIDLGSSRSIAVRWTMLNVTLPAIASAVVCATQLTVAPTGITVTLWGTVLRRVPEKEIRFLTAVNYSRKLGTVDCIAICMLPYDVIHKKCAPKLVEFQELWEGEWVYKHLARRASRLTRDLNGNKDILWLEWTPERMELLRSMYPQAQWMDCSSDKRFEKQLRS